MREITLLDQHQLGMRDPDDSAIEYHRRAARAVLIDADGRLAIMYFSKTGSYKLPGGGIDEGESIEEALHREVREETGYTISDIKELGVVEENRYFCGMHQMSYCYLAKIVDFVGTALTEKETNEGMELKWFDDVDSAISAIESGSITDEEGSAIGLEMMKLRDVAILRAAYGRV